MALIVDTTYKKTIENGKEKMIKVSEKTHIETVEENGTPKTLEELILLLQSKGLI